MKKIILGVAMVVFCLTWWEQGTMMYILKWCNRIECPNWLTLLLMLAVCYLWVKADEYKRWADKAQRTADEAQRTADEAMPRHTPVISSKRASRYARFAQRRAGEAQREADEAKSRAEATQRWSVKRWSAKRKADKAQRKADKAQREADEAKREADEYKRWADEDEAQHSP